MLLKKLSWLLIVVLVIGLWSCETGEEVTPDTSNTPNNPNSPITNTSNSVSNDFATEMLNAVNTHRTQGCTCGNTVMSPVNPLTWSEALENAARRHAEDMEANDHFSHTGTDGSSAGGRISDAGYDWRTWGENIARGQRSITAVVEAWKNSEGHCKNMMSPDFKEMGAAQAENFWVQVFARR